VCRPKRVYPGGGGAIASKQADWAAGYVVAWGEPLSRAFPFLPSTTGNRQRVITHKKKQNETPYITEMDRSNATTRINHQHCTLFADLALLMLNA